MITSDATAADPNSTGLFLEIDAILAVVIGGTSLAGGRFSLAGTVIGAFIIQTMTTMILILGIAPEITLVYKAGVVAAVCLIQSPEARAPRSTGGTPGSAVPGAAAIEPADRRRVVDARRRAAPRRHRARRRRQLRATGVVMTATALSAPQALRPLVGPLPAR